MTAWVDVDTITQLLKDLTGLADVTMEPGVKAMVSPTSKGQIRFDIKATQALGVDDFIRVYDSGLGVNVVTQAGNRLFSLYVKMESFNPNFDAYETLERLRTRLFRPSSLARLRAKNMTATSAEATIDLPTSYDNRVISAAALDIKMALRIVEDDGTDDGQWIETYSLSGPTG